VSVFVEVGVRKGHLAPTKMFHQTPLRNCEWGTGKLAAKMVFDAVCCCDVLL